MSKRGNNKGKEIQEEADRLVQILDLKAVVRCFDVMVLFSCNEFILFMAFQNTERTESNNFSGAANLAVFEALLQKFAFQISFLNLPVGPLHHACAVRLLVTLAYKSIVQ